MNSDSKKTSQENISPNGQAFSRKSNVQPASGREGEEANFSNNLPVKVSNLELKRLWDGRRWSYRYQPARQNELAKYVWDEEPSSLDLDVTDDFNAVGARSEVHTEIIQVEPEQSTYRRQGKQQARNRTEPVDGEQYVIRPSLRSEINNLILFALVSFLCIRISTAFPGSIVIIPLQFNSNYYTLYLPCLLLFPLGVLAGIFFRLNNRYAVIDEVCMTYYSGVCSFRCKAVEMETDTMLVVQISQTPFERLLNTGTLSIGRFSRKNMEVDMKGVGNPKHWVRIIKALIRDARRHKANSVSQKSEDNLDLEEEMLEMTA